MIQSMQTDIIEEPGADGKLHVFSLYSDFAASRPAIDVASSIIRLAGPRWQPSSEMWKPEVLTASEPVRKMVSDAAVNSDVLIIAISSLEQRPVNTICWLDSLTALQPEQSVPQLLIGLLGDEDSLSRELDWTLEQLIRCARKTNRDFIWHWMESNNQCWLNGNVAKLLDRKRSLQEQMISQETAVGVC
jgi:hypothetical protein